MPTPALNTEFEHDTPRVKPPPEMSSTLLADKLEANASNETTALTVTTSAPETKQVAVNDLMTQGEGVAEGDLKAASGIESRQAQAPQSSLASEEITTLAIDQICADPEVQTRVGMNAEVAADYAERMRDGVQFPPVIVFFDGAKRWLADGFHRLEAARSAGLTAIRATVKSGGRQEAIKYALGANACHGLRRSNADKRRAVKIALKEFTLYTDRVLADMCGVGNALVSEMRKLLFDSNNPRPRTGRDGKHYQPKRSAGKKATGSKKASSNAKDPKMGNEPEGAPPADQPPSKTDQKKQKISPPASANGTTPDALAHGWISDEWITEMIKRFESKARPKTPKQKEESARHRRLLTRFAQTINAEMGHEPTAECMHAATSAFFAIKNLGQGRFGKKQPKSELPRHHHHHRLPRQRQRH